MARAGRSPLAAATAAAASAARVLALAAALNYMFDYYVEEDAE